MSMDCWRVGNRKSSNSGVTNGCPSLQVNRFNRLLVPFIRKIESSLIDEITKGWNLDLVHQLFKLEEATIISNISLSHLGAPDKIYWLNSKYGLFLVGSAYYLEVERNRRR